MIRFSWETGKKRIIQILPKTPWKIKTRVGALFALLSRVKNVSSRFHCIDVSNVARQNCLHTGSILNLWVGKPRLGASDGELYWVLSGEESSAEHPQNVRQHTMSAKGGSFFLYIFVRKQNESCRLRVWRHCCVWKLGSEGNFNWSSGERAQLSGTFMEGVLQSCTCCLSMYIYYYTCHVHVAGWPLQRLLWIVPLDGEQMNHSSTVAVYHARTRTLSCSFSLEAV